MSVANRLIATTTGTPNRPTFSMCFSKVRRARRDGLQVLLLQPGSSGLPGDDVEPPGVHLERAGRADHAPRRPGSSPAARHLMCMNFSKPMSAPKPLSVTT